MPNPLFAIYPRFHAAANNDRLSREMLSRDLVHGLLPRLPPGSPALPPRSAELHAGTCGCYKRWHSGAGLSEAAARQRAPPPRSGSRGTKVPPQGSAPVPVGGCVPVRPPSRRDHGDGLVQAGGRAGEWGLHRGERGALQYARPRAQRAPQSRDGARGEDWRERLWPPPLRERGRRRRS